MYLHTESDCFCIDLGHAQIRGISGQALAGCSSEVSLRGSKGRLAATLCGHVWKTETRCPKYGRQQRKKKISGIAGFFRVWLTYCYFSVNDLQVLCSSLRLHQDHFRQCIQPHTLLDRMSKDVPDRMSRDMPERMSEDVPDKMSEDMLERLPDIMSEDLPDRIPSPRNLQPFKNECSPLFLPALLFIGPTSLASEGQSKAMRAMPQKGHHAQQAGGTSGLQG